MHRVEQYSLLSVLGFLVIVTLPGWILISRMTEGSYLAPGLAFVPVLLFNVIHGCLRSMPCGCSQAAWRRLLRWLGSSAACPMTCYGMCPSAVESRSERKDSSRSLGHQLMSGSQSLQHKEEEPIKLESNEALAAHWIAWVSIAWTLLSLDIDRMVGVFAAEPHGSRDRDMGSALAGDGTRAFGLTSFVLLCVFTGGYCFMLPFVVQAATAAWAAVQFSIVMFLRGDGGYVAAIGWSLGMVMLHIAILYSDESSARHDFYVRYIAEQGQKATGNMLHAMLPEQVTELMLKRSGATTSTSRRGLVSLSGDLSDAADDESWILFIARLVGLVQAWECGARIVTSALLGMFASPRVHPNAPT